MKISPIDDTSQARCALLDEASKNLGRTWAEWWFEDLRRQGRPVTGGWPGTISEARARARAHMQIVLTQRALPPMTQNELTEAARVAYNSARDLWFGCRVRDEGVA